MHCYNEWPEGRVPDTLSNGVDNSSRISYAVKGEQKAKMTTATELRKHNQTDARASHSGGFVHEAGRPAGAGLLRRRGGGCRAGRRTAAGRNHRTDGSRFCGTHDPDLGDSGEHNSGRRFCAYVDVSDSFDPLSAAALGVDLRRMLWIRAGVPHCAGGYAQRGGSRGPHCASGYAQRAEAGMGVPAAPNAIPALSANAGEPSKKTALGRGGHHPRTEAGGWIAP